MKRVSIWCAGVLVGGAVIAGAVRVALSADAESKVEHCVANLGQIDGAKDQYALDNGCAAPTSVGDLVGTYIKNMPICVEGGTYSLNNMGEQPTCSKEGHGLKPDPKSHAAQALHGHAARSSCLDELRKIGAAKDQYALDNKGEAPLSLQVLVPSVLKTMPKCPDGGFYKINALGVDPTCSKNQPGVTGHKL